MEAYGNLIARLDDFIRKYYRNRMLQGLYLSGFLLISLFVFVAILEYFGRFSTNIRTFIFYTYLLAFAGLISYYVLIPIFQLFKIGKIISHKQAAQIIGTHFADVKDKLLNTLELKEMHAQTGNALVAAAIDQRIKDLRPVPFTRAIDTSRTKRFAKLFFPPVGIVVILLLIKPTLLTSSANRIVKYNEEFEIPAPFTFTLDPKTPNAVIQGADLGLNVSVSGEELPQHAYIEVNGNRFKLDKKNKTQYSYQLTDLQQNTKVRFFADGFYSKPYSIEVLEKPVITGFDVQLVYPKQTGKQPEKLANAGELVVPEGTRVTWIFKTEHTGKLLFRLNNSTEIVNGNEGTFTLSKTIQTTSKYAVIGANNKVQGKDTISYAITTIPDNHPSIEAQMSVDSLNPENVYFAGNMADDYGFSKLQFRFRRIEAGKTTPVETANIKFEQKSLRQSFFHFINLNALGLKPGEKVEFWFEVWDNDAFSGPKSSRTSILEFKEPTREEAEQQEDKNNSEIEKRLDNAIKEARKIRQETDKLNKKLLDKKELSWDDQKKMKELAERQQKLTQDIQEAKKLDQENRRDQLRTDEPISETILEKQRAVQEMFDKLLNEELKQLMEELKKLMEQQNKEKFNEDVKKFQFDNKELEKELDRMQEMLKQAQFEEKFEQTANELEKLAKEQEKLSEESLKKGADPEEIKKKQDELNKKFDELDKKLEDLEKQNQELEKPNEIGDLNQESGDVKQDQQQSSSKLQKKDKKGASENQQKAANQMKRMADKMKQDMQESQQEQLEEDMAALRMLLENLIRFSFNQERLIDDLTENPSYSPAYVRIGQDQRKLQDDAKMIEDSLFSLSKRAPQIGSYINKEIAELNRNMESSVKALADRNTAEARARQQYVMTHTNNLAVMLSESFKQMQQQMQEQQKKKGSGSGSCNKPGQGKPGQGKKSSMGSVRKMQEELNKQLQEMRKGQKPGGKEGQKPGQKPGQPGQSGMPGNDGQPSSSDFAKAVAKQEAIRREIQKMTEQLRREGKSGLGDLDKLQKEMEKTEEELVNKQLSPETLKRQQEILTRLLEAEKAEQEREQDNKRESKSATQTPPTPPAAFEEFQKNKQKELELFRTVNPELNPFFKQKVEEYFRRLNNQ